MTKLTKEIGTSVMATIGVALGVTEARFGVLLKLAQGVINYQVKEDSTQEEKAEEWNKYFATVTLGLSAHEAVMVGAIVALYLQEGILEQAGAEDMEEPELTPEGEPIWPATGKEGWAEDTFRDVT